MQKVNRPKFLDLKVLSPAMSITGKLSILHRVSGVLMFIALPILLIILGKSLSSTSFYDSCVNAMSFTIVKLIILLLVWAMSHHMLSGIRFLLLDMHVGIDKKPAQISAKIVLILALILTVVVGYCIW